jgi:tetratricopeptide (TPR) repeat protein
MRPTKSRPDMELADDAMVWHLAEDEFLGLILEMHAKGHHEQVRLLTYGSEEKGTIKSEESRIKALHVCADSMISAGCYEEAIFCYDKILLNGVDSTALNNRGLAYWECGQLDRALEDYLHAIEIDPQNPISLRGVGAILDALGRSAEALEPLQKAVELDPEYSTAWRSLGIAYYNCEIWNKAYDALKTALSIDPADILAGKGISKIEGFFDL